MFEERHEDLGLRKTILLRRPYRSFQPFEEAYAIVEDIDFQDRMNPKNADGAFPGLSSAVNTLSDERLELRFPCQATENELGRTELQNWRRQRCSSEIFQRPTWGMSVKHATIVKDDRVVTWMF